jgi:hypothetical protein
MQQQISATTRPDPETQTQADAVHLNYELSAANAGSNVDPTLLFNGVVNNDGIKIKEKAADKFYKFGDINIGTNNNSDDMMLNINKLLADHNEN